MEYPLTSIRVVTYWRDYRLNPCSNGIPSDAVEVSPNSFTRECLNPCSNGIPSDAIDTDSVINLLLSKSLF